MQQPEFVLCLAYSANLSQMVVMEKNHPEELAGKINGPGGGLKATDNSSVDGAIREFLHETGVPTSRQQWFYLTTIINPKGEKITVFCSCGDMFLDARTMPHKVPEKTEPVFVLPVVEVLQKENLMPEIPDLIRQSTGLLRNVYF